MKKILCTIFAIVFFQTPAFALLAPLEQSLKEMTAIITSREISNKFPPAETIQKIIKGQNSYLIQTERHEVNVEILEIPSKKVGPKEFKFVFGPLKDKA